MSTPDSTASELSSSSEQLSEGQRDSETLQRDEKNFVRSEFGWDPIWIFGLAAGRRVSAPWSWMQKVNLGGRFEFPVSTIATMKSWRLLAQLNAEWRLGKRKRLLVAGGLASGLVMANDSLGKKMGFNQVVIVQPGYQRARWRIVADLRWRFVPIAHIRHSDVVRSTFEDRYPESTEAKDTGPKDGWYRFSSHRLLAGLHLRAHIWKYLYVFLRGGLSWQPQRQKLFSHAALGQMPFYLRSGVLFRW